MRRPTPPPRLLPAVLAAAVLALATPLRAQHTEAPEPPAYALDSVTLVTPERETRAGLTVVVRDAFVRGLGADVEIPADAKLLEGDSLRVYPGLVDAEGEPRVEFPSTSKDDRDGDDESPAWNPSRVRQGFTPHRRAAEHLTATADGLEDARKSGVVASAVHPEDGLMPGRSTLLLHRLEARRPGQLVRRAELGPVMAFEDAGVYPSTLFGVIAFLRQQFEDARRHARLVAAHREGERGITAPGWDPDLAVVQAALQGRSPVYFRADRAEDIRRVLEMSARYGFRPVIVGGREAWKVADRLRERDVPVLVSLDFPSPERWEPSEEEPGEREDPEPRPEEAAEEAPPGQAQRAEAQEEELEPAALREKRRLEAAYANAGRLHEAGVTFALTSGGGDADLLEGARRAIEYGLPEDAALAALTRTPARLLGAPEIVGVERARPATFIVADGPLFEEGTRVLYTFVEGRLQRGHEPGASPEEPPAADLTGSWTLEIQGDMGSFEATLEVQQGGGTFDGTMSGQFGTFDVVDGVVSGEDVSFTVLLDMGGESAELSFSGTVEGDTMSGSGSGPPEMGSFTWEASRAGPGGTGASTSGDLR